MTASQLFETLVHIAALGDLGSMWIFVIPAKKSKTHFKSRYLAPNQPAIDLKSVDLLQGDVFVDF